MSTILTAVFQRATSDPPHFEPTRRFAERSGLSPHDLRAREPHTDDLAAIADALLELYAQDRAAEEDGSPKWYSDNYLRLKENNDRMRARGLAAIVERAGPDPLERRELFRAIDCARLTERQREAFLLRMGGETFAEIGRTFGSTKQRARAAFSAAVTKIVRARRDDPLAGFAEVYNSETRRGR